MNDDLYAPGTWAVFENPQNGYRERIPALSHLWMLLFGIFYMAARALWMHVSIWIMIVTMIIVMPWVSIFAFPVLVWYAWQAPELIAANYRRRGWLEVDRFAQHSSEVA